jgi:hypothetical protein
MRFFARWPLMSLPKRLPVIPAGTNVFEPTEMIASRHFQEFLSEIARGCELGLVVTGLQSGNEGDYEGYYSSLNEGASAA